MSVPVKAPSLNAALHPVLVVAEGTSLICTMPRDESQPAEWSSSVIDALTTQIAEHVPDRAVEVILFVNAQYCRVLRSQPNPWAGIAHELVYHGTYSPCGDHQKNLMVPGSPFATWLPKVHIVTLDYTDVYPGSYQEARLAAITNITNGRPYDSMMLVIEEEESADTTQKKQPAPAA